MKKDITEEMQKEDSYTKVEQYLLSAPSFFWEQVDHDINHQPTISAYTTTYNCISQEYPWEKTIESMLGFADEVVVLDGGSNDGTWEKIQELSERNSKIIAKQHEIDFSHNRFAVQDGSAKARARKLCSKEFCVQMDSDEYFVQEDFEKIKNLVKNFPSGIDLIALPVVEFWGSYDKVRLDINPEKWRVSRNKPDITHGIPFELRMYDLDGEMYAAQGTDGCDPIFESTGQRVPFMSVVPKQIRQIQQGAIQGFIDQNGNDFFAIYEDWFKKTVDSLPAVRHESWLNIERKIKTYKNYWGKHWQSLYDINQEDTPENNMFFNSSWKDVSDDDISSMASRLANEMGGWVFHSRVDFSKKTKWISW